MTSSQEKVFDQINEMISSGQGISLLQKLEFDIIVNDIDELSNYLLIILILVEHPKYFAEASDLLIRKVLLNTDKFSFLESKQELVYQELFRNRVLPYVGLSEVIRRLTSTLIYDKENDSDIISKIPKKGFLIDFNIALIKDFFKTEKNIDFGTSLLYDCWDNVNSENKIELSRKAIDIYRGALQDNFLFFDDYLHLFLRFQWYGGSRQWDEGKLIVPEPFYEQIFGSVDDFLSFLDNARHNRYRLPTNDVYRLHDDIRNFMRYYLKNKYVLYDDPKLNLEIDLHYRLVKELSRK